MDNEESGQKTPGGLTIKSFSAKVVITDDHRIVVKLPEDFPVGEGEIVVTSTGKPKNEDRKGIGRRRAQAFGMFKGQITMLEGFDDPLEDFAEYM